MLRWFVTLFLGLAFSKTLCQAQMSTPCQIDTTILLVNIGDLDSGGLIELLNNLEKKSPKAIGLNAFFGERRLDNDSLKNLIKRFGIVIAGSKNDILLNGLNVGPSVIFLDEKEGVVSFSFNDRTENDEISESFSLKILKSIDSLKYKKFVGDTKEYNIIYRGNKNCFTSINYFQVMDLNDDFLQNRVVLVGYLGKPFSKNFVDDSVNAFFTPTQPKSKKVKFNMYETVIMANILSLILSYP